MYYEMKKICRLPRAKKRKETREIFSMLAHSVTETNNSTV